VLRVTTVVAGKSSKLGIW